MPYKKIQCCAFCKNHDIQSPKKGHICVYKECTCLLCELTRKAQKAMRHQQRFWRHQKNRLRESVADMGMEVDSSILDSNGKLKKGQVCDKCRNHNRLTHKKNHVCPYASCQCEYCHLTFQRREIMKHQQRVRRSNITTSPSNGSKAVNGEHDEKNENESPAAASIENEDSCSLSSPEELVPEPIKRSGKSISNPMESLENYDNYSACNSPEEKGSRRSHMSAESSEDSQMPLHIPTWRRNSPPPLIPICTLNEPHSPTSDIGFGSPYSWQNSNCPSTSAGNCIGHTDIHNQCSLQSNSPLENYCNNFHTPQIPLNKMQGHSYESYQSAYRNVNHQPQNLGKMISFYGGSHDMDIPELITMDNNYQSEYESDYDYSNCSSPDDRNMATHLPCINDPTLHYK